MPNAAHLVACNEQNGGQGHFHGGRKIISTRMYGPSSTAHMKLRPILAAESGEGVIRHGPPPHRVPCQHAVGRVVHVPAVVVSPTIAFEHACTRVTTRQTSWMGAGVCTDETCQHGYAEDYTYRATLGSYGDESDTPPRQLPACTTWFSRSSKPSPSMRNPLLTFLWRIVTASLQQQTNTIANGLLS